MNAELRSRQAFLHSSFCVLRSAFMAFVVLSGSAFAQGPDSNWRTISTPHFRIHYPVQYEAWAKRAASDIESVREAVVREVGFSPPQITDILVVNPIAESNGATLPFLDHPRIVLFTDPPEPESQIGEFSDWIDLLTVHEMAHLVHLLRPSRNPLQRMLSHLLPINPIALSAPRWVLEGYATVIEGRLTGSGRPASSIRAAILRKWAISGRLPAYSQLNSDRRFLGMSMAYLAGSAFLEWLERRSGPNSLRQLWARMTARQRRSFDQAFEGVFGEPPERLYGQFTAELTERAMAVERSEERSLREGELWQKTTRGTGDPVVSPDGSKLAFVQRNERGEAKLIIVSTGPNPEEGKFKKRIERMLKRDPEDVAPVRTKPIPRKPLHTLKPRDGGDITSPRWTRDGNSILYTRKQPDREGFLHHDLFLWTPAAHRHRRVTHLADVEDADPMPDGQAAIAVRNRNGFSQLVIVNFAGEVKPYNEPSLDRIFSHPRASADGRIAWAEHDGSGWRVGKIAGAFSPEWSGDKLYATVASGGFIDIARIDDGVHLLTRTAGAALDPAPAPDGSLYFMSLEPDGLVIRNLKNVEPALSRLEPLETRLAPAIPPVIATAATFQHEPTSAPRPYGFGRPEWSALFGGSWTAYDHIDEYGVRVGDVVGRFDALAIAASGGGAVAATWRGWPVATTAHIFRHGVEIRGNYEIHAPLTLFSVEAGGLGGRSSRAFVDSSFAIRQEKSSVTLRVAADSKNHVRTKVRAGAHIGPLRVAAAVEAANRMTLGGVASSVTPDALLIERVLDPALPIGFAEVKRYRGARGELTLSGLTAFWQRHASHLTVRGIEWTSHAPPVPLLGLPEFDVTAGAARVSGVRGTKGWLALRWRP
jgi:hypothetical protein